jgi:hypothetical protein
VALIEQDEAENCSDPGHCLEQRQGVGVVLLRPSLQLLAAPDAWRSAS